jgi:hypothetical protein
MTDLINEYPNWGETGSYPPNGFFYDGGDQVNEKHLDALWNAQDKHQSNLNSSIRNRVRDLHGNVNFGSGLVASTGNNTREIDVTSTSTAYVDGERVTSVGPQTVTLTSNNSGTRTDTIYLDDAGSIGVNSGSTSVPNNELKVAEADVDSNSTISAVRNYARDHLDVVAAETAPPARDGDLWYDIDGNTLDVRRGGTFETVPTLARANTFTAAQTLDADLDSASGQTIFDRSADQVLLAALEEDDITVTAGDGLAGGGSAQLGTSTTLDVRLDIDDSGSNIAGAYGINFGNNLTVTDDNDDTVTVDASLSGSGHAVEDDGSTVVSSADLVNFTSNDFYVTNPTGNDVDVELGANSVGIGEIDTSITPTWTGKHTYDADIESSVGTTIYNRTSDYVPLTALEFDTFEVSAGDGLDGGGSTQIGNSLNLSVNPNDLNGDGIDIDGNTNFAIDPSDFAGNALSEDTFGNLSVQSDSIASDEIDQSDTFTWTDRHTWNSTSIFNAPLEFGGASGTGDNSGEIHGTGHLITSGSQEIVLGGEIKQGLAVITEDYNDSVAIFAVSENDGTNQVVKMQDSSGSGAWGPVGQGAEYDLLYDSGNLVIDNHSSGTTVNFSVMFVGEQV